MGTRWKRRLVSRLDHSLSWLYTTDPGTVEERGGKNAPPRRRNLKLGPYLALLLSATWLLGVCAFYKLLPRSAPTGVFRASDRVFDHPKVREAVQLFRESAEMVLEVHPEQCGVSGANMLLYKQVMLLRVEEFKADELGGATGRLRNVLFMNPEYSKVPGTATVETTEESMMCGPVAGSHASLKHNRSSEIVISFLNKDYIPQQLELRGASAVCAQHHVDVMRGQWPCLEEPARRHYPQFHVPSVPSSEP